MCLEISIPQQRALALNTYITLDCIEFPVKYIICHFDTFVQQWSESRALEIPLLKYLRIPQTIVRQ